MVKLLSCLAISSLLLFGCNSQSLNNISVSDNQLQKSEGAKVSVNINFKALTVKASTSGVPAKTINDIKSAKLYLTSNNSSNPLLASNIKFSSGVLVYPTGSSTKTYTFYNVPAGTYYAGVELFEDVTGTKNIIEPITYDSVNSGDTAFGMTGGKRGLTLSSNSAVVDPATMALTFSDSSSAFNVTPKLMNAMGASLDTTINPQSGNNVTNPSITLQ